MPLASLLLGLLAAAPGDAGRPGTLETLGHQVAAQLIAAHFEPPYALKVEAAQPGLAQALAAAVGLELPPVEAANPEVHTAVQLVVGLEGTALVVRGSWASRWVNFWAGAEAPATKINALPEVRVDADARAVALATGTVTPTATPLPAVPLALRVQPLAQLPQVPAALGCQDLDGDGKPEIAVLLPDAVLVLAADGRVLARSSWPNTSPTPGREPFGAINPVPKTRSIEVFSGRQPLTQVLTLEKGVLRESSAGTGAHFEGMSFTWSPGMNSFAAEASVGGKPQLLPAAPQAFGSNHGVRLFVFANGGLSVTRTDAVLAPATAAGAAAALADFDGDGTPEVLTTAPEPFPIADVVSVLALADVEAAQKQKGSLLTLTPLWRAQVPRGRALVATGCDLNGDGKDEAVLGAWLEDGTGELSVIGAFKP